jgi:hypothetical protein
VGLKTREVGRLTVLWSFLIGTVVALLAMLWPAAEGAQDTQAGPAAVAQRDTNGNAAGWSLLALVQADPERDDEKVKSKGPAFADAVAVDGVQGMPAWAWGVGPRNTGELYERWVGFAATQGSDHFAVDSVVDVLRKLGWKSAENMVDFAIQRSDWRVTSAIFASGFVGIEDVERQELVRRSDAIADLSFREFLVRNEFAQVRRDA